MSRRVLYRAVAIVFTLLWPAVARVQAETRQIDTERSSLTVLVFKSGVFSAFADDHVIRAPIASGSVSDEAPLAVQIAVRSGNLKVLDPKLAPDRRAEVQTAMLGAEVLDVTRFPDITFTSTSIEPAGAGRWMVSGRLAIHGQTQTVTFPVTRRQNMYRGDVSIRQRDFGIEPIRIAGGTVRVKNEVKIQSEIATLDSR